MRLDKMRVVNKKVQKGIIMKPGLMIGRRLCHSLGVESLHCQSPQPQKISLLTEHLVTYIF